MPAANPPPADALRDLYRHHHGWLLGWLRRRLHCTFDAADLAHDTFIRILARDEAARIREPRAYLATMAHGLLVNHLRRRDLERAYLNALAQLPQAAAPSPETRALVVEALCEIDAMLDGLPAAVRRAFLLCQLEGLPHADISRQLGVSISSVRQYIARALRHCLAFV